MDYYDLAIIGAGWAGFGAAIRASQLGLKVVLIERASLGGTCLNYGCISTKSLLQSAKIYSLSKKASNFGIHIEQTSLHFKEMQDRKNRIIEQLRKGMQFMIKNKNITYLNAHAKLVSDTELSLGQGSIKSKYILIATGSRPMELNTLRFDARKILSSDEILNLDRVPSSILIVGGGVIGCEFASLFNTIGSRVTIVELLPWLLPQEDREIAKRLETMFKKRGIQVNTSSDARNFSLDEYEIILVSTGRMPNTRDLGLDKIGINLEKDRIIVDDYLKTNVLNIYAAGDCTGKTMLAHFASYQGRQAAENIARPDDPRKIDSMAIPNCIFTQPEVSRVGLSEEEAKKRCQNIEINRFDFLGSGLARIMDETEGLIKIIWDKKTEQVLGASIIGPGAVELIGILTLAMQSGIKVSQIQKTVFAHPTLSEGINQTLK